MQKNTQVQIVLCNVGLTFVEESHWQSHNELKQIFPSADYVGNGRYVFNIQGNNHRLVAIVVFVAGIVKIRFVGTHAEYDKIDCKTIQNKNVYGKEI